MVERVLVRRRRPRSEGLADAPVEVRIADVVRDRVGRVAHDDADVALLLALPALGVVGHDQCQLVLALTHGEGVGEQDALEGHIVTA